MWRWEVIFQDINGELLKLHSSTWFDAEWKAKTNYEASFRDINEALQALQGSLIIDEQIVYQVQHG